MIQLFVTNIFFRLDFDFKFGFGEILKLYNFNNPLYKNQNHIILKN